MGGSWYAPCRRYCAVTVRGRSTHDIRMTAQRRLAALLLAVGLGCSPAGVSADQQPIAVGHGLIAVAADRVAYYADAAIMQAHGNVRVTLGDGTAVEGDAFSMDLSLRRLLVVGHVRLETPAGAYSGAAFANFLPFRRAYFVPLDPSADRWTFLNGDYGHPEMGRVMPGDAFFLPDMSAARPYIVARSAVIDPSTYVEFKPAKIALLDGPYTPALPSFVDNFSQNPNFGVNALSGAAFDAPYAFRGSSYSLDAIHMRYDQKRTVKAFLSFEHHSVFGDGGYAVMSLNPATQLQKQWNLLGYDRVGERAGVALNTQLFTVQSGILQPSSASGFADLLVTRALSQSSLRLDITQIYDNLLNGATTPDHPFVAGFTWAGFDQPIAKTGFSYRARSGIAKEHNIFGISSLHPVDVSTRYVDATVYSPLVAGPFGTAINASVDAQRTWASFPNVMRSNTLTVSDGKRLAEKFYAVASVVVATVDTDSVNAAVVSPNVLTGFAPQPVSQNGLPVLLGSATVYPQTVSRTYVLATAWQPSSAFQFGLTLQKNRYSPAQLPPPYQLNAAFRTRLTKTLFVDVGRSYFFNWQNQGWSPQFTFQVSSQ
jgi:hypothetical protein